MTALELVPREYEGKRLTVVEMDGGVHVIAHEIGRVLGYKGDGFTTCLTRNWADDMREGEHLVKVEGAALALFKGQLPDESSGSRARHLLLLTERGLLRALMLAGGPVAVRFRDWAETVLLKATKPTALAVGSRETVAHARELRLLSGRLNRQGQREASTKLLLASASLLLGETLEEEVRTSPQGKEQLDKVRPVLDAWRTDIGSKPTTVAQVLAMPAERLPTLAPLLAELAPGELGYLMRRASAAGLVGGRLWHGSKLWVVA